MAERVTLPDPQRLAPLTVEIPGNGFTVTTAEVDEEQPVDVIVPITVYVVVVVGEAVTDKPIVLLKPDEGDHENVFAPVADNVTEDPEQIEAEFTLICGFGFTVTLMVVVVAFCPSLGVNVYVADC